MPATIVLVHGARRIGELRSSDRPLLSAGHRVIAAANPLRGLAHDATAVSDLVRPVDGPVALVGHSYCGSVISNVNADAGEITGLLYVAGFAPDAGESCLTLTAIFPSSTLKNASRAIPRGEDATDLYMQDRFQAQFAADVPEQQAPRMAVTQRPVTQQALNEPSGARPCGRAAIVGSCSARMTATSPPPSSTTWPSAPAHAGPPRSRRFARGRHSPPRGDSAHGRQRVHLAREAGALGILPIVANYRAGVHLHAGEFDAASALMEESAAITQTTGTAPLIYSIPMLAAYRGDEAQAMPLLDAAYHDATVRGQGLALSMIGCARAVLFNGLARYDDAVSAAAPASVEDGLGLYSLVLIELIEGAVRGERPELAAVALERLTERTRASNTDWALGIEARSRALLTDGPAAEALYEEAVARLSGGRVALHLARAQLVYGEWLRRENRRLDARRWLGAARDLFDGFGAGAFAERARRELLATGETARRRTSETLSLLTPQEAEIARLAGDGLTNPEIATQLFISPRTVEYHLRKVFPKLNISSRKELRNALAGVPGPVARESD